MDGHRPDPLTDSSLEREIEAALYVDPSPAYLARIRIRIAEEATASGWPVVRGIGAGGWGLLTAGMAVAIVALLLIIVLRPVSEGPASREAAAPPVPASDAVVDASRAAEQKSDPGAGLAPSPPRRGAPRDGPQIASPTRAAAPSAATERPGLPEVLVSPDERRAMELLLAATRERVLELPPGEADVRADRLTPSDVEIAPIPAIAPLRIEPLPPIARLEIGERQ
jgi:hypothetical protein